MMVLSTSNEENGQTGPSLQKYKDPKSHRYGCLWC